MASPGDRYRFFFRKTASFVFMNNYPTKLCDDKDLLSRLGTSDEDVFDDLYRKYWSVLIQLAAGFLEDRDTCKEIVQELFVTLYKSRHHLKINISLSSYLYVSLRNRIRNHVRRESIYNRHIRVVKRSQTGLMTNDVEQSLRYSELERSINACLNEMPAKYKEVWLLYQQTQCTMKVIAKMLHRPVDTVEKQLRKAVCLLREHLTRQYINL
jgi:RNA polymerase sigma factor (sigma-70 family)